MNSSLVSTCNCRIVYYAGWRRTTLVRWNHLSAVNMFKCSFLANPWFVFFTFCVILKMNFWASFWSAAPGCSRSRFSLFFFLCVICGKVIIDDCIKVMTLGLGSIGKCGFRFWNADFRFCNRTRPPKSEKGFAKLLSWTVVFFLLIMLARARLLFRRTVFQILFQISQKNGKKGDSKTDILALKSVFGFRVWL